MAYKVPEEYRITEATAEKMKKVFNKSAKFIDSWVLLNKQFGDERTGMFMLPNPKTGKGLFLLCKASGGEGWEHVSISIPTEDRCPTWPEMCFVKSLFWGKEDTVVQFHPPEQDYVNNHEFCLHLWKPTEGNIQTPPPVLVGIKM